MSVLALLLLVPLSQSSSGAPTCDLFGFRMATIPDLNGDRQPDILVADPWDGDLATCRGRVWAISGTDFVVLRTWRGEKDDLIGLGLGCAGDSNSDGVPDVYFGSGCKSDGSGSLVRFHSGKDGALLYTLGIVSPWLPFERSGAEVCVIGDVDGDGVTDFVLGSATTARSEQTTRGFVVLGGEVVAHSGKAGRELWRRTVEAADLRYGASLALACDADHDGVRDLAVAACPSDLGTGYIELLSVKDGRLIRRLKTPTGLQRFTGTIAGTCDLNRDGIADLLAMSGEQGSSGTAIGLSGMDGSTIRRWSISGGRTYQSEVVPMPDVNGDGCDDLLLTAPGTPSQGSGISVFSGRGEKLLWEVQKDTFEASNFGCSVISVADHDGDGVCDILVGEATWRGCERGVAHLYSGRTGTKLSELTRAVLMRSSEQSAK